MKPNQKSRSAKAARQSLAGWTGLVLMLSGCATTKPVAPDALVVTYRLDREKVAKYFERERGLPVTEGMAGVMDSPHPWESFWSLALILPVALAEASVGGIVDQFAGPNASLVVPGFPAFAQELHWGDNEVRLPKELAGTRVTIWLIFRGDYGGNLRDEIDLSSRRP